MSLAALAFVACGGWEPNPSHFYHLAIASGFSDAQYQAIRDAASEWQASSGNYVTFDPVVASVSAWGTVTSTDSDVIAFQADSVGAIRSEFGGGAIGYTQYEGQSSNVYLGTSLDAETFHQTALHEIGHAIGLKHTTPGTVMCQDTTCATLEITCGDLVQLLGHSVAGCTL
jgi:predicted Zn-dependent protease